MTTGCITQAKADLMDRLGSFDDLRLEGEIADDRCATHEHARLDLINNSLSASARGLVARRVALGYDQCGVFVVRRWKETWSEEARHR